MDRLVELQNSHSLSCILVRGPNMKNTKREIRKCEMSPLHSLLSTAQGRNSKRLTLTRE